MSNVTLMDERAMIPVPLSSAAAFAIHVQGCYGADSLSVRLGITISIAPLFSRKAGSTHGYDVVDHNTFNPEVGSRADFENS